MAKRPKATDIDTAHPDPTAPNFDPIVAAEAEWKAARDHQAAEADRLQRDVDTKWRRLSALRRAAEAN